MKPVTKKIPTAFILLASWLERIFSRGVGV